MIIKKDGRYYIALHEATTLEDISDYQTALVDIISCATQSGLFDGSQSAIYSVCGLLQEIMLTSRQMCNIHHKRVDKLFDVEVVP